MFRRLSAGRLYYKLLDYPSLGEKSDIPSSRLNMLLPNYDPRPVDAYSSLDGCRK
jgi:hypothetical protein